MYYTSYSYSHNPGVHGILLSLSVSYCTVDEYVDEYERVGYIGHGNDKGDMSGNDGDERRDISGDDGENMGSISVYDGRHGFKSQETRHSYSHNCEETVDGDWRGGYRYNTIHYSSHTQVIMVDYFIYLLLLFIFIKFFMTTKEVIVGVMTEDVELVIKRPSTVLFTIT